MFHKIIRYLVWIVLSVRIPISDGSRGAPTGPNSIVLAYVFAAKHQSGTMALPNGAAVPQQEILDPPLPMVPNEKRKYTDLLTIKTCPTHVIPHIFYPVNNSTSKFCTIILVLSFTGFVVTKRTTKSNGRHHAVSSNISLEQNSILAR